MDNKGQMCRPMPIEIVIIATIALTTCFGLLNAGLNIFSSVAFAVGLGMVMFSLWIRIGTKN